MKNYHSEYSAYREMILEHKFISETLCYLWQREYIPVEVLRSEVDDSGYDLIMEYNSIIRHIQLKSSISERGIKSAKVHTKLQEKRCGCVIYLIVDKNTLDFHRFLWFGSNPMSKLPDISDFPVAKHIKRNKSGVQTERPEIRVVSVKHFTAYHTIAHIVERLFGVL